LAPNGEKEQRLLKEQLQKKEMRLKPGIPFPVIAANIDRS
tara:strand:+ start:1448 stop:1567 length:120 start_codon:yes stop_codon:yes gene_type:complete